MSREFLGSCLTIVEFWANIRISRNKFETIKTGFQFFYQTYLEAIGR